jgi:hypothetical protein
VGGYTGGDYPALQQNIRHILRESRLVLAFKQLIFCGVTGEVTDVTRVQANVYAGVVFKQNAHPGSSGNRISV